MRSGCTLLLSLICYVLPASGQSTQPDFYAEIWSSRSIHVDSSDSTLSHHASDWAVEDATGNAVQLAEVLPHKSLDLLLIPAAPIDIKRVYYARYRPSGRKVLARRDPWFRSLYSEKELGAIIAEDRRSTTFRIFAPRATGVTLHLYTDRFADIATPALSVSLTMDPDGVWETTQAGDHHGVYYDYTLFGPDDPGDHFYGTNPVHISDPYARVSDDSFGKSRVWQDIQPPRPVRGGRPAIEDVIAYEVHVQDFTWDLPVDSTLRGTFDAMHLSGLTNRHGVSVGFDYLVDLGINTIHLMPVQEYLHYPDREWKTAFRDDPYMIENGISEENYQWGYRTTHAFALESRYRRHTMEPGTEREQFRNLVDAFHAKGISVIIDVVPNHTGENMDGRQMFFNFGAIDRPYYYRTDNDLSLIGPFGNEVKSEERPMVQRWMRDQLLSFVNDFGVDGFRIDLAGQIDEQTLKWLNEQLPENLIIYGEAWIAPSDKRVREEPDWAWYKSDAPITFFQDDARNAFKGPVSNPVNKETDRGFAGGNAEQRENTMRGLSSSFPDDRTPTSGINYLDIHDNWTLADRFARTGFNGLHGVDEAPFRLAATLLFTSLGPIVLQGGTEIMRSKGAAPLKEVVKETESGKLYMHGMRDTYNLRTPNLFLWDTLGKADSLHDTGAMLAYWKGLIRLRRSDFGSVFRTASSVRASYYDWILPENTHYLGYFVDEKVGVFMNTDSLAGRIGPVDWPDGSWLPISDGKVVDLENGVGSASDSADLPRFLDLEAQQSTIWINTARTK